jgi:O-acetyl-ADP-ribose deacetylase (regulator of RNase III)
LIGKKRRKNVVIKYVKGDLLKSKCEALVNTVNCVGVMGKGIALQFKREYPEMFQNYKEACARHEVQIGKLHTYGENPLIINFPTKIHWRNPSQYEWIRSGLSALGALVVAQSIKSVAIPPLGCGNGGLDWEIVKSYIKNAFHESATQVEVYRL